MELCIVDGRICRRAVYEYLEYWEITNLPDEPQFDPELREFHRRLYELGEAIGRSLHPIAVSAEVIEKLDSVVQWRAPGANVSGTELDTLVHALGRFPIVRDCVGFHLAMEAADLLLGGAEKRVADLIAKMGRRHLGARATAFLDRATRLYLWGFEPECVVMCGAVLEAAYEERFSEQDLRAFGIAQADRECTARDYERAALVSGSFTPAEKKLAASIRRARNDIVHNAPGVGLSASEALDATAQLLDRLFPGEP